MYVLDRNQASETLHRGSDTALSRHGCLPITGGRSSLCSYRLYREALLAPPTIHSSLPMLLFSGPVADHARARYHNTTSVTLLIGEVHS